MPYVHKPFRSREHTSSFALSLDLSSTPVNFHQNIDVNKAWGPVFDFEIGRTIESHEVITYESQIHKLLCLAVPLESMYQDAKRDMQVIRRLQWCNSSNIIFPLCYPTRHLRYMDLTWSPFTTPNMYVDNQQAKECRLNINEVIWHVSNLIVAVYFSQTCVKL